MRKLLNVSKEVGDCLDLLKYPSDSYDSVLRRVLGLKEKSTTKFQTKYPIEHLQVGEVVAWPWERDKFGEAVNARSMSSVISQFSRKTGRKFHSWGEVYNLKVQRVK